DQHVNVFYSRVNIQLLEKYLKEWSKELVFVSTEHRLIRLVLETDFQIFPDLDALEQNEPILDINAPLVTSLPTEELLPHVINDDDMDEFQVEVPMYRTRRRKGSPARKILVSLFALAILAGLFWVYKELPIVTVEVRPTIQNLEKGLEIICEHGLTQVRSEEKKIPLLTNMFDVSGSIKIPTTGRKRIGFTRAEGVVTFLNHQNKAVTVPSGTVLKTGTGIKYKTVKEVTVPKLSVEYYMGEVLATKAGRAEVKIIALEAGTSGNIAKERITQFEGKDYGLKLLHPEPTKGGSDREEMIVTQADLDRAIMNLETTLKDMISEKIHNELGSDYLVLQDTLNFQLETVQADQQVDAKAEELTVNGKMIAYGYHLLKDDLRVITKELFLAEM
ncbi:MAG: baseplate J/gp47 family protein, partial [Desulfobacterales bacterium]|nr:baseplate J/gp47 family protein [Desulfobacterales bacterium]